MNNENYFSPSQKIKDLDPSVTIKNIKAFLDSIECHPKYKVTETSIGTYSAILDGSEWGLVSYGKGVTPELCEASAYGEFIERIQNLNYGLDFSLVSNNFKYDFQNWPDEKEALIYDSLFDSPELVEDFSNLWKRSNSFSIDPSLLDVSSLLTKIIKSPYCYEIPYYDVFRGNFRNFPLEPLCYLTGTIGLCAGNSPEEALVQGLSETFERWAEKTLLQNNLTPPEIPLNYIQKEEPYLYTLIQNFIKKFDIKFNIKIYDISFGKGIPVVAILILDRKNIQYKLQLGAHPLFKIALERCLTELEQCLDFSNPEYDNVNFIPWNLQTSLRASNPSNAYAQSCWALASIPSSWCFSKSSWEFKPWNNIKEFDNEKGLNFFLNLLQTIGYPIYIRDTTLSSLYTYSIYIPDFSVFPRILKDNIVYSDIDSWGQYLDVEWENCILEEKIKLLDLIKSFGFQFLGPIYNTVSQCFLATAIALELGDLDSALIFIKQSSRENREALIVEKEIELKIQNLSLEDRDSWLSNFFDFKEIQRLNNVWRKENIVESLYENDEEYSSRKFPNINLLSKTKDLFMKIVKNKFPKNLKDSYGFLQKYIIKE